MNLLEEAKKIIIQEKIEAEEKSLESKTGRTKAEIKKRFFDKINNLPVIVEMISLKYANPDLSPITENISETIWNLSDAGAFYYTDNIGKDDLNLMQDEESVSNDGVDHWTVYYAWAVKFSDIYGLDIYLIPYINSEGGFACTVVGENGETKTFLHDIPRDYALNHVVEHLRKNAIL